MLFIDEAKKSVYPASGPLTGIIFWSFRAILQRITVNSIKYFSAARKITQHTDTTTQ